MLPDIRALLYRIADQFVKLLGTNMVGFYVHGSLAMGGFNPRTSDVDFLVVVHEALDLETKQAIIAFLLEAANDAPQKGLEMSVVLLQHTRHFVFPTPYELHLSPYWYDRARNGEIDLITSQTDPDLAAHFMVTRQRGWRLFGQSIEKVFERVPHEHYWASLMGDLEGIVQDIQANPVYGILNICRIAAYKQSSQVLSKREGGLWGLQHFDQIYHALIQQALNVYQAQTPLEVSWDQEVLTRFAEEAKRRFLE
jgi:predicted nucleotidyltransferase